MTLPPPQTSVQDLTECCCPITEIAMEWESRLKTAEVSACGFEDSGSFWSEQSVTTEWEDPGTSETCESTLKTTRPDPQIKTDRENGTLTGNNCTDTTEAYTAGPCDARFSQNNGSDPAVYTGTETTEQDIADEAKSVAEALSTYSADSVNQDSYWSKGQFSNIWTYGTGQVRPFVDLPQATVDAYSEAGGAPTFDISFGFWRRDEFDSDEDNWTFIEKHDATLSQVGTSVRWRSDTWVDFPDVDAIEREVIVRIGKVRI